MSNILNISKSALSAAQVNITTTGHNIANATTEGYSRQVVVQSAAITQATGYGYVGKGVQVVAVNRVYNDFLSSQVNSTQSKLGELSTYHTQISQIDNLLADSSVGLTPALDHFFTSIGNVSADADSPVTRQSLLSSASTLVSQFHGLAAKLTEIGQGVNQQISATVNSINSYATELASLNDQINKSINSTGDSPNDLLDKRDQLITELSEQVQVSVVKDGNSYNVYVGSGQPLVVGKTAFSLSTEASDTDPGRLEVVLSSNGTTIPLSEKQLTGGNLAGLLRFRSETLDEAQNTMGRMATVLASSFNAQHRLGMDLNGDMGGDFFSLTDPVVTASTMNNSTGVVSASITDATLLTTSNYTLSYDGTNYAMTRASDGKRWTDTSLSTLSNTVSAAEGFSFTLDSGTIASGDSFMIKPTANGASGLELAISDVSEIAVAAPIVTDAASTNSGTATISPGTVDSNFALTSVASDITLTYASGSNSFTLSPAQSATVTVNGTTTSYASGASIPYTAGATITFGGISVAISGKPADGDTFTIGSNVDGKGDNRNALLLSALQTTSLVADKTATIEESYSQLVNTIGNKTNEMLVTSQSAEIMHNQAVTDEQSESGVNTDEEATKLIEYQQAYQAAAKLLSTSGQLFDYLLSVM